MRISMLAAFCLGLVVDALAHGRSAEMVTMLNAPVPEWMSLAEPIKVEPVNEQSLPEPESFRPRSGGAVNSRDRVQIPAKGIEIRVDYEIDWTGDNLAGTGASLSPDGTRLVVNSGPSSHLYDILPNGEFREVPSELPNVTYDEGPKGFLRGWSWADNSTLIARAEILDDAGHEIIENRIYVYHMQERVLSRLDLSALNLSTTDGLAVVKIQDDLKQLRMIVGTSELTAKADLKTAPKVQKQEKDVSNTTDSLARPNQMESGASGSKPSPATIEPTSSTPLIVAIVAGLGILWFAFLRRKAKITRP